MVESSAVTKNIDIIKSEKKVLVAINLSIKGIMQNIALICNTAIKNKTYAKLFLSADIFQKMVTASSKALKVGGKKKSEEEDLKFRNSVLDAWFFLSRMRDAARIAF